MREEYPAGVPSWIDTSQPDPAKAAEFYGGLFGWECTDEMPAEAEGSYFMARLDGQLVGGIGSQAPGADETPAWATYVAVDNADATTATASEAGGTVVAEPFDVGSAGRMAILADPAGAVFSLWQAGDVKGAQLVNAPGSWNFSDLLTSDLEGAKHFYGTVFGWEYSPFFDEGDAGYWRRPGYGDFLESINPGTRERNAEMGAPDRFEDAVATVAPLGEGQETPHWALTLATGDADATASRARELGATVLQEPTDLPWVRLTVLVDPQGAVFTASQFKPPG